MFFSFILLSKNPNKPLIAQAAGLRPAILSCIRRARHEGTSLIVEGTHLVPELYGDAGADLSIVLSAPQLDDQLRRLQGRSHLNRTILADDFKNTVMSKEHIRTESDRCGVHIHFKTNNL